MPSFLSRVAANKKKIALCLGIELALVFTMPISVCILRQEHTQAFGAWRENPSAETQLELQRQKRITLYHQIALGGFVWICLAAVSIPLLTNSSAAQLSPPCGPPSLH